MPAGVATSCTAISYYSQRAQKLTPPGKPSTWFPGEGLVTQAQLFHSLSALALYSCSFLLLFALALCLCSPFWLFVLLFALASYSCYLLVLLFCSMFLLLNVFLNTVTCHINLVYVVSNAFWNFINLTPNLLIFWNFATRNTGFLPKWRVIQEHWLAEQK